MALLHAWLLQLRERTERGASGVEYGLLVAGVAAVIVTGVFFFGGAMAGLFDGSCDSLATWVRGGSNTCTTP